MSTRYAEELRRRKVREGAETRRRDFRDTPLVECTDFLGGEFALYWSVGPGCAERSPGLAAPQHPPLNILQRVDLELARRITAEVPSEIDELAEGRSGVILPTVGVITTTLIVLVTKVFDIVKVSTGGNFGTNVLANDMVEESFAFFNVGKGAAIAMLILISVLPVMVSNVWKMQKERMAR